MSTLRLPGAALKQGQPSWFPGILALLLCKHHHFSADPGSHRVPNPRGHRDNDLGARWEPLSCDRILGCDKYTNLGCDHDFDWDSGLNFTNNIRNIVSQLI